MCTVFTFYNNVTREERNKAYVTYYDCAGERFKWEKAARSKRIVNTRHTVGVAMDSLTEQQTVEGTDTAIFRYYNIILSLNYVMFVRLVRRRKLQSAVFRWPVFQKTTPVTKSQ